jgi:hypothetical protein
MLAALWLASPVYATPITIIVNTTSLAGTTVDLAFDLTASTANTVKITDFSSDGALDDSTIALTGDVSSGMLSSPPVIIGGTPGFDEYLQSIALGDSLAFTFDTTMDQVDPTLFGPDSFVFFILVSGVPVDTGGPGGALLTFDFGIEVPVLTLFSSDTLPVGEGIVTNVVEPGALALVIAALLALAAMLPVAQIQLRK